MNHNLARHQAAQLSPSTTAGFTTDDIAIAIEIPGLYDGTACWLLKDGRLINRFAGQPGWGNRAARVDEWIAQHGDSIRERNRDLLETK